MGEETMITVATTKHWWYAILAAFLLLAVLEVTVTARELRAQGRPSALMDLEAVQVSSDLDTSTIKSVNADCPSDKVTTGGGYVVSIGGDGDITQIHVVINSPSGFSQAGKPVSWGVGAIASSTAGTWGITATAICAKEGFGP
jgi:hypothetical protein